MEQTGWRQTVKRVMNKTVTKTERIMSMNLTLFNVQVLLNNLFGVKLDQKMASMRSEIDEKKQSKTPSENTENTENTENSEIVELIENTEKSTETEGDIATEVNVETETDAGIKTDSEVETEKLSEQNVQEDTRQKYHIIIPTGSTPQFFSNELEQNGVIENASSLVEYLREMEYLTKIRVGEYDIPYGATNEEVYEILKNGGIVNKVIGTEEQ